jgi:sulfide:quinone oxidoreductase
MAGEQARHKIVIIGCGTAGISVAAACWAAARRCPGAAETLGRDGVSSNYQLDLAPKTLRYDLAHLMPPQSAPGWIRQGPLADPANPGRYVQIDKHTMRYPNVFSLGDAGSSPNSKTGAAIRKQAPVVAANLAAVMAGRDPAQEYDGYASCPLTTARNRMLLAEFDYTMKPRPTIPLINTQKERYDMWLLKRYGLPFMYWNLMLNGRA